MKNDLELVVREAGRKLADYQIARIFKVPEELQQTPCDFFGYTVTGRAILIECKQVYRTSLPIGKSPGLSAHQWNELCDASRAGCLALICWARGKLCATISVGQAAELSEGRRSIPWDGIDPDFHRPLKALEILDHWLPIR